MNFETLLELKRLRATNYFMYSGSPLLTNRGYIISPTSIDGHEEETIVITDDPIYAQLPLAGIVSDNILSFVS